MCRVVIGVVLWLACVQAQPRRIAGTVVDQEGNPIIEASIDHSGDRQHAYQTDANGRFELDATAPAVVIRKAGFRSEFVRTQDANEVRITLQKLRSGNVFPTCSDIGHYEGIKGWDSSLQFLSVDGVRASRQGQDIDYGTRNYYVKTRQGSKGIRHGSGPLWGFLPSIIDVWTSIKYDEVMLDVRGMWIIDARGQSPDGNRWRYLGKFGESASYWKVDEETAKTLDRFLDGACLKPQPRR